MEVFNYVAICTYLHTVGVQRDADVICPEVFVTRKVCRDRILLSNLQIHVFDIVIILYF